MHGQGHVGRNGGPNGDLIISIAVSPHPMFTRDGFDVHYTHPVSFVDATLGGELEIPTIDGKVKYNLPAGTQGDTTFRLKGKGIPALNGRGRPVCDREHPGAHQPERRGKERPARLRQRHEAQGSPQEGVL